MGKEPLEAPCPKTDTNVTSTRLTFSFWEERLKVKKGHRLVEYRISVNVCYYYSCFLQSQMFEPLAVTVSLCMMQ